MSLPVKIARRYLFAKKSTNAINIISGISVFGMTIGTAALIIILSVFNGFEELILQLYSVFDPDIKVEAAVGKNFAVDEEKTASIYALSDVESLSYTLEETVVFAYDGSQAIGKIKGVDGRFNEVVKIDTAIRRGSFKLKTEHQNFGVLGLGMRDKLSVNVRDRFTPLTVYVPDRKNKSPINKGFKQQTLYPTAVFAIQPELDEQYVLSSLTFVQSLLDQEGRIGTIDIKLKEGRDLIEAKHSIQKVLGNEFTVKTKFEQQEAFLKIMNIEKWLGFAIISLTLILVAFNLIGALWMIVLDKKRDISILRSMGAEDKTIKNIFLYEGLFLSFLGLLFGFVIGLVFVYLQKTVGIIRLPEGSLVPNYPISLRWTDFLAVFVIVSIIGYIASIGPALKAKNIKMDFSE